MKLIPFALAVLLLVAASWLIAAPILPQRHVTDEVRSLADLSRVRLAVEEVPATLAAHDIHTNDIRGAWSRRLRVAGIEQTDDRSAPRLWVKMIGGSDPTRPGSVAYTLMVELSQAVRVERLDQKLVVPTYTDVYAGMGTPETVADAVAGTVRSAAKGFVGAVKDGTVARSKDGLDE